MEIIKSECVTIQNDDDRESKFLSIEYSHYTEKLTLKVEGSYIVLSVTMAKELADQLRVILP